MESIHMPFRSPSRVASGSQHFRSIRGQIFPVACGKRLRLFMSIRLDRFARRYGVLPEMFRTSSTTWISGEAGSDDQGARQ